MALTTETKILIGVLAVTVLIIVGGAWWAGRPNVPVVADSARLVIPEAPVLGDSASPVTVVEFGDFECPACAALYGALKQVKDPQGGIPGARFVFRQYPLPQHPHAALAAEASLAAHAQGKFWEYHNQLFEHQDKLAREDLIEYARAIGLNVDDFTKALDEHTYKDAVQRDQADGLALRIQGTPSLFINGVLYTGNYAAADLKAAIEAAAQQPQPTS
jgi:protein-disulfide isomerase